MNSGNLNFNCMKRGEDDFSGFSEILRGVRLPKVVRDHLRHHALWAKWPEIVGPELSRVTSPREIKSKSLEISVAHQAWAQQLHFLRGSILNRIRQFCPDAVINDLEFRVGKVKPSLARTPEKVSPKKESKEAVTLSERQEMTLRAVADPELRRAIRAAMESAAETK